VAATFGQRKSISFALKAGQTAIENIVLEGAGAIGGKIVDSSGNPIEGARLTRNMIRAEAAFAAEIIHQKVLRELHNEGQENLDPWGPVYQSNKNGDFLIPGLEPGKLSVYAWADGYSAEILAGELEVVAGQISQLPTSTLFESPRLNLTILSKATGLPVKGVNARWSPEHLRSSLLAIDFWREGQGLSDESGNISLINLPTSSFFLSLQLEEAQLATGLSPWEEVVHLPEAGMVLDKTIWLDAGFEITAKVVNASTGLPITEFDKVVLRPTPQSLIETALASQRKEGIEPFEVSAEGHIQFRQIPAGQWTLSVEKDNFSPLESESLDLNPDNPEVFVELSMEQGASLLVRVLDELGNPQTSVAIGLNGLDGKTQETDKTDKKGEALFEDLKPGKYQVTKVPSEDGDQGDIRFEFVDMEPGQHMELVFEPQEGAWAEGVITKGGEPFENGSYALLAGSAVARGTCDENGNYHQENLAPGPATFIIGQLGGIGNNYQITVEIHPGRNLLDVDLPGGKIQITVIDEATGEPIPGMLVAARESVARGNPKFGFTDNEGISKLEFLESGSWEIAAGKSVMPVFGGAEKYGSVMTTVDFIEGEILEITLNLSAGASFKTRVVGTDGQPVPGASVFYLDEHGQPLSQLSVKSTNSKGVRQLDGLPGGPGRILVRHPEAGTAEIEVDLIAGELVKKEIHLETGCTVFVQAVDENGFPLKGVLVNALDYRGAPVSALYSIEQSQETNLTFVQGGEQSVGPLLPGTYTFLVYRLGQAGKKHIVVIEAGVAEMHLELET